MSCKQAVHGVDIQTASGAFGVHRGEYQDHKRQIFVERGVRSKINRLRCFAQIPQAAGIVLELLCGSHLLDSLKAAGLFRASGVHSDSIKSVCSSLVCSGKRVPGRLPV